MRKLKNIMVTGGAGFIGANFIHYLFEKTDYEGNIINIDKLTYAGNLENLITIEKEFGNKRYYFEKADINDYEEVRNIFDKYKIDTVVHFAAESHVDRSISGPKEFIHTNILGTFNIIEAARQYWESRKDVLFHHISTDEVYGSLEEGYFYEDTRYSPNSPYAASKASSDHLIRAYNKTYNLPVTISNCSNNYGPYQFPEKMIPLMIINALAGKELPVYGEGKNVRDWLYVDDHCDAIWAILNDGQDGEVYNIGTDNQWKNIDLINLLCEKIAEVTGKSADNYKSLIKYVKDRPGHDLRYAVNADKIKKEINWCPKHSFEEKLKNTIKWYVDNTEWVNRVQTGEYKEWIKEHYES